MRCPNCGEEVKNESYLFCTRCGYELRMERSQEKPEKEDIEKKGKKLATVLAAAAVTAVLMIIFIVNTIPSKTIKLDKYIKISFEGYDSLGKAAATLDIERFEKDYGEKLKKESGSDISSAVNEFLEACVDGKLNKQDRLSNGDVVEYVWSCDEGKAQSEYGYKLKYSNIKKKVKGLNSVRAFDPFDGIEIVFEGVGPKGQAYITGKPAEKAVADLTYDISKCENLSDGDVVTVSVNVQDHDPDEYFAETYGMIPTKLSQDYTVEGLGKYAESVSEISNADFKALRDDAEDRFRDDSEGDDYTKYLSLEYLGSYFLSKGADADADVAHNTLYLLYREKIKTEYLHPFYGDPYDAIQTIYSYAGYSNLVVGANGELKLGSESCQMPTHEVIIDPNISTMIGSVYWSLDGYESREALYSDITEGKLESYTIEENISDSPLTVELDKKKQS